MSVRSLKGRWDHIAAEMMGHFSTTLPNSSTNSSYVSAFTALMSMAPARVLYKLEMAIDNIGRGHCPLGQAGFRLPKLSHLNISNCIVMWLTEEDLSKIPSLHRLQVTYDYWDL